MTSTLPDEPHASWAMPIAIGAVLTVITFVLLRLIASLSDIGAMASCCCLGPTSFAPIGFLTTVWARRRDAFLTPGQAFAIVFIGVGLGSVVLAGVSAMTMDRAALELGLRDALEAAAADRPDVALSTDEREEAIALMMAIAPYSPLLMAAWQTLAAALVGLFTASLSQRRFDPPVQMGDPTV